jgi:hypothetical protein
VARDVLRDHPDQHTHDLRRLGREVLAHVLAGELVDQLAAALDGDLGAAADLDVALRIGQVEDGDRNARVALDVAFLAPSRRAQTTELCGEPSALVVATTG